VLGQSGNGGDIGVAAATLVMNTGFIQANTAARAASGGNVTIDVAALIPSGDTLVLAAAAPQLHPRGIRLQRHRGRAPDGISGNVEVSSPALDLAGALRGLSTAAVDFGALGRDPCRVGAGSSLTPLGRGGLPASAGGLMRPEPNLAQLGTWGLRWHSSCHIAPPGTMQRAASVNRAARSLHHIAPDGPACSRCERASAAMRSRMASRAAPSPGRTLISIS